MRKLPIQTIIATAFLLTACTPMMATRGNLISPATFQQVQVNTSTRADVVKNWGPPTVAPLFEPDTWYYIGEIDSQKGIFAPAVDKRRMVRVKFDPKDNNTVVAIDDIDPKLAENVPIVSRTTPAAGKDFTVVQQFIGNLGKYNPSTDKK